MASVYIAEDIKHKCKVALKILKPELAAVIGAEHFLSEIQTRLHDPLGILHPVERLDFIPTLTPLPPIHPLDVLLLDVCAVTEHHRAKVLGGQRGIDAVPKALTVQLGEQSGVIDVGVREQDRVDLVGRQRELVIELVRLRPPPLTEPTVHEDPATLELQQMERAGDGLRRPPKRELHEGRLTAISLRESCDDRGRDLRQP
jgi:hypothetical protein